jgi:hypothetical protein
MMSMLLVALTIGVAGAAGADGWQAKVHPMLLDQMGDGPISFFVHLHERADLSGAAELVTKEDKGRFVVEALIEVAECTQSDLVAEIEAAGVPHRRFWIINAVLVEGDGELLERLARRNDVARVSANPRIHVGLPDPGDAVMSPDATGDTEWGIDTIFAPDVWDLGFYGEGVVVGNQDTGIAWDHPAIINQYRGWNGTTADHDYNWHDAIHSGGGVCGADSTEPCDDHGHGTHTTGTVLGDDGADNQIGVAPAATWIGCRNMDEGYGTPAYYTECFEFFLAPYPVGGDPFDDGDPSLAPHVMTNSWACPPNEGCSWETLQEIVETTRAAGIPVIVAAMNEGPSCSTVSSPPAIYEAAFSIGATNIDDDIAGFSSRGPVIIDDSDRMKPDVSAPGVGVRSCLPGGGYASWNGTSMATPHVSGLAALLLSAEPGLTGDVDRIEEIIELTARPMTTTQGCGDDGPTDVPNNVFGHGIVSASAAVACLDCDDSNDCTVDSCDFEGCLYTDAEEGASCGDSSDGICDNIDTCDGLGECLPNHEPDTTLCRDAVGECDVEEFCTGLSADCPDDEFAPDGTPCNDLNPLTENDACLAGDCVGEPLGSDTDGDDPDGGGQAFDPGSAGCGCEQVGDPHRASGLLELVRLAISSS